MSLLISLGVNATLAIQFAIFLTVFVILKYVLFSAYFAAFNKRAEATVGQTELAEHYINETKELEEQFAMKAQVANERFRAIYDQTRGEAMRDYDKMVADARARTKSLIETTHANIEKEMAAARSQIGKEVPEVAKMINQKMIGKDLTT